MNQRKESGATEAPTSQEDALLHYEDQEQQATKNKLDPLPWAATRRGRLRRPATTNTQKTSEPNRKPPEQAEEQKTENSEKAKARHRRTRKE